MFRRVICVCLALMMFCAVPAMADGKQIACESTQFDTGLMNMLFPLSFSGGNKSQLSGAGFSVLLQEHLAKDSADRSHTSGFTLSGGQMTVRGEKRNVLLITVNGTTGSEWYSNFDFSFTKSNDGLWADNFHAAAEDIWLVCKGASAGVEDPVWLITGYSRGAACANLLGVMADEEFGAENVYVYAFACPNTMKDSEKAASYSNIFNILNPNDPITHMPLSAWGYTRAGVDKVLSFGPDGINNNLHQMMACVYALCPDTDAYYNKAVAIPGMEGGVTLYQFFLSFADMLCGTPAQQQAAQMQMMQLMSIQTEFSPFLKYFAAEMSPSGASIALFEPHMPTAYQTLMKETFGQ